MTDAQVQELMDDRTQVMPLSVDQYHRMIETGILESGQPFELLDGVLIRKDRSKRGADPMTVGSHHAWAVRKLASLDVRLTALGCFMQTQQPVTLPPIHEPEPDGAIATGSLDDFRDRHPGPDDLQSVIEVADASLRRDRTTKLRIYANAGVPQYVIVNLVDLVIEEYTQPRVGQGAYGQSRTLTREQMLGFFAGGDQRLMVAAAELLP